MPLLQRVAIGKSGPRKDDATEVIKRIDQSKIYLWHKCLKIEAWLRRRGKKHQPEN